MIKMFKILVTGILTIGMVNMQAWAVTDITSPVITLTASIAGSTSLTVTPNGTLSFDTSGVTLANPWVVADGYVNVEYSSNYSWGIRIITHNEDFETDSSGANLIIDYLPGLITDLGTDGAPGGTGTDADSISYGGMLSIQDIAKAEAGNPVDPSNRATLAWQASDDSNVTTSGPVPTSSISGFGILVDANVGDPWAIYDDWMYIGDQSDTDFEDTIYNGGTGNITGAMMSLGFPGTFGSLVPAISGNADGSMDNLDDTNADGKGDFNIFIAARFASTNYHDSDGDGVPNPTAYTLPAGTDYKANLYIELIHE